MRIGFIGLGNMGGSMALNLMKAGHQVTVNDVRRAGRRAASGRRRQVGRKLGRRRQGRRGSSSLRCRDRREVEAVVLGEGGLIGAMAPGSLYIDLSTNSPDGGAPGPRAP